MSDLSITVLTPSYNQSRYLPNCLSSVAIQQYRPVEHLVYDPGSSDDSRNIAEAAKGVTLVCENDRGQSDAVNKGVSAANGEIIAWLNSDDEYADETVFQQVIDRFSLRDQPDVVYGRGIYLDGDEKELREAYVNRFPETLPERLQHEVGLMQPAMFVRKSVFERVGELRIDRHFTMDYEFWIRCVKAEVTFAFVDSIFAKARYHADNKTLGRRNESYEEICEVVKEHFGYVHCLWLKRFAEFLSDGHDGVAKTGRNSGIRCQQAYEKEYQKLLVAYNGDHDTCDHLTGDSLGSGELETARELEKVNWYSKTPCKEVSKNISDQKFAFYVVGPRRFAFDASWKGKQIRKSHNFLSERIQSRERDTCIIVGNGPSLNLSDLALLEDEDVIVSNNAFLSDEVFRHASYYTVVNYRVAEQSGPRINRLESVPKVVPYWLSYCLNASESTYYVDAVGYPKFSTNMFENMSWRHTVTFFNMHLAYGLGYRKVVLIGFDHSYTQPKDVKEEEMILSFEKDENHFIDSYFQGKEWQAADVDMMEEMYKLAKEAYEQDGREILNATVGGRLELFKRRDLAEALKK